MVEQLKTDTRPIGHYIAMVVVCLMAIGTVFVFSASADVRQEFDWSRFYEFAGMRQILFFPLAVVIMYLVSMFDYRLLSPARGWFRSPQVYLLAMSVMLLILVLLPQFGREVNYARRWLRIPAGPVSISFQPSEFAKWVVVFFLAGYCDKFADDMKKYWKRFVPVCMVAAVIVLLIIKEDFGTAAFISLLTFLMLIMGGTKLWYFLTPLPMVSAVFYFAIITSPSRIERIKAFLNPSQWSQTAAYQANQSLIALGSGGLWGKGLGRGICKYGHLPEDTTDFVFAIIGEELGFAGTATVIMLFIIFVWLGILVVARCKDYFGRLLAGGIVLTIAVQAAVNIAVVTVVLPTKGIALPFVSAGGTGMLLTAAAVGVLLNIANRTTTPTIEELS